MAGAPLQAAKRALAAFAAACLARGLPLDVFAFDTQVDLLPLTGASEAEAEARVSTAGLGRTGAPRLCS